MLLISMIQSLWRRSSRSKSSCPRVSVIQAEAASMVRDPVTQGWSKV